MSAALYHLIPGVPPSVSKTYQCNKPCHLPPRPPHLTYWYPRRAKTYLANPPILRAAAWSMLQDPCDSIYPTQHSAAQHVCSIQLCCQVQPLLRCPKLQVDAQHGSTAEIVWHLDQLVGWLAGWLAGATCGGYEGGIAATSTPILLEKHLMLPKDEPTRDLQRHQRFCHKAAQAACKATPHGQPCQHTPCILLYSSTTAPLQS